jgi:acid phosphatase
VYYANAHYSLPNYFWLTTGSDVTLNEGTTKVYDVNNMIRYLMTAGKTWKAYEESLPYTGYIGASVPPYAKDHNPFAYLSDVAYSSEKMNIVPFTKFSNDLSNHTLPRFSFIVPNNNHNGHNGQLGTADSWLKSNLSALLANSMFQSGGHGILIITFDESVDTDCRPLSYCPALPENHGGGRVANIIVSPMAKRGYRSATKYQHQNVLRTVLEALGIYGAPNAASTAKPMSDFFQ